MRTQQLLCAALLFVGAACANAGKDILVPPASYDGAVELHFFRDVDGNSLGDVHDSFLSGVRVALLSANGTDTLGTQVSDANGTVRFLNLPFGNYRYVIFHNSIADSLVLTSADTVSPLRVLARLNDLKAERDIALDYPRVTIAQARTYAPGKRVSIIGTVLSPFQVSRLAEAYIKDSTGTLRITNSTHEGTTAGDDQGENVRVVGTTGTNLGQPVLLNGFFQTISAGPPPTPRVLTMAQARTALNGTLDAAFVQVSGVIVDTSMVIPDYHVTVADALIPGDRVEVLIDQLVVVTHSSFKPGVALTVRGVLKPKGDGTWILMPRIAQDITFP